VKGHNMIVVSSNDLMPGVFYYELESGASIGVKKMIIVK